MFSFLHKDSSSKPPVAAATQHHHNQPTSSSSSTTKKPARPQEVFFSRVSFMLDQFSAALMTTTTSCSGKEGDSNSKSVVGKEEAQTKKKNPTSTSNEAEGGDTSSSSTTLDRVAAYALLSECNYQGQVEALRWLKQWFQNWLQRELVEKILDSILVLENSSSSSSVVAASAPSSSSQKAASSSSPTQTLKRIASFLAPFSKLVTFSRICYLALEQPQFLGKYLPHGTSHRFSSSSSSHHHHHHPLQDAFLSNILRSMLRDVAAAKLKPFILKYLPVVVKQARMARLRRATEQTISSAATSSPTATTANDEDVDEEDDSAADINEEDLTHLAHVVSFFRDVVAHNVDDRYQDVVFRKEFFDSYLDELRHQFATLAKQFIAASPSEWALRCFSYLESLMECEKKITSALFAGQVKLQLEGIRAARGAFVSVCAVPLVMDPKNGLLQLLRRNDLGEASKLIGLVASEPDAIPHLKQAVEQSIKKHLELFFENYTESVTNAIEQHQQQQQASSNKKSSTTSGKPSGGGDALLTHEIQSFRLNFVKDLLGYIHQWNGVIARSPDLIRVTLERIRRNSFRAVLNNFALKTFVHGRGVAHTHIAEVLAHYCDLLLRGEMKGSADVIVVVDNTNNKISSEQPQQQDSASSPSSSSYAHSSPTTATSSLDHTIFIFDLVAQLVSFFKDKDLLIEYHRARTAKRLLEHKATLDMECTLTHKLSHVVEMSQTRKFEGMFADAERWVEDKAAYDLWIEKQQIQEQQQPNEFSVAILTSSKWPAFRSTNGLDLTAFPALHRHIFSFERFYKQQTQSRKLTWVLDPCTAVMTVSFPKGTKEISMTWVQAFVLIAVDTLAAAAAQINQQEQRHDDDDDDRKNNMNTGGASLKNVISFCCGDQQQQAPTIVLSEIKAALASLALNSKFPVVIRSPTSSSSSSASPGSSSSSSSTGGTLDTSNFELNPDFSLRVKKFSLPKVAASASSSSSGKTSSSSQQVPELPPEILAQRDQVLDASIVRIMKSRQQMQLPELCNMVSIAIKSFPVTFKQVKKRVEGLMERDFLSRDEDTDVFSYVA